MVDTNILLVDDDQDTCASMSDIFLDLGYTVDMAYDGPGALKLSEGKTWDHTPPKALEHKGIAPLV